MRPCGRAATPSLPSSTSSHLILLQLAHPALGSAASQRIASDAFHGCSRAFRRTKDVILSREQGMQAGPMPVAVFVGYVMPQGSEFTGYGDGGDGISLLTSDICSIGQKCFLLSLSTRPNIESQRRADHVDPATLGSPQTIGLSAETRSTSTSLHG
jgi:hypothetical protein